MPVYIINPGARLVRANSRAQAIRHVASSYFKAEVATGETVADLMKKGVTCEDARAPETGDLPLLTPAQIDNAAVVDAHMVALAEGREPTVLKPDNPDPYLQGITDRHDETPGFSFPSDDSPTTRASDLKIQAGGTARLRMGLPDIIDTVTIEGIDHVR